MSVEKHETLSSLRRELIGTSDSWEVLSRRGRPIKRVRACAKRDGLVLLHSWNDRLGYRGVTACSYDPTLGWEVVTELFDQEGTLSRKDILDAIELPD